MIPHYQSRVPLETRRTSCTSMGVSRRPFDSANRSRLSQGPDKDPHHEVKVERERFQVVLFTRVCSSVTTRTIRPKLYIHLHPRPPTLVRNSHKQCVRKEGSINKKTICKKSQETIDRTKKEKGTFYNVIIATLYVLF